MSDPAAAAHEHPSLHGSSAHTLVDLDGADTGGLLTGPWACGFFFTIPFDIRSKSNYRKGAAGRGSWSQFSDFEHHLALLARKYRPAQWELADDLPLPRRPVVIGHVHARTMLDTLNLDKSLGDAIQPVLVSNDASVMAFSKTSQRTSTAIGGLVAFAQLPATATLGQVADASMALQRFAVQAVGAQTALRS